MSSRLAGVLAAVFASATSASAADYPAAARVFEKYCTKCHAGEKPKGELVLRFKDEADAKARAGDGVFWTNISRAILTREMPPEDEEQPTEAERAKLVDWITRDMLAIDCDKPNPGRFMVHRLNNREYANTLRDLLYLPPEIRGIKDTPNCPPELLRAMQGETEHCFDYIVREDRSIMEFLDADYTFVNATLAKHYGIEGVEGDEFRKVTVDRTKRGGLFTQASFLTLTSKPLEVKGAAPTRRTSPVNRGKWILENIFNQELPPAPPNVPSLEIDDGKELKGTVRQIFEQHRVNPKCAECHANGVHIPAWYPDQFGSDYTMSRTLAPLADHQHDFLILNNLALMPATLDSAGDHAKAMGCYLT